MKKATNKILSLALVVMMLLGTFAMMFAYADAPAADAPVTTPKAYDAAADGEKLYDVDFSSEYFTAIDDTQLAYDNNGVTYSDKGLPCPIDPADGVDGNGDGDSVDLYAADQAAFLTGWRKNLTADAVVVEENGAALKIDGAKAAIGTEGEEGYVPAVPSEATAADQRYIGQLNTYDLENKTYTYQFEYFRKGIVRSKFYFANGTFMNFGSMDQHMPCLGIELNASGYRLMRQSSAITQNVVGKPQYTVDEASGETRAQMKVVLAGGEIIENVTLYAGTWTTPKDNVGTWVGNVVPINYTIYMSITKENGDIQDIRVSTGLIYQPADVKLVFGIGEYNNPAAGNIYGARNLAVYKGDTSVPFNFGFTNVYAESGWGEELTIFDAKGITNPANNFANGYEWTLQSSTTVDAEGVVFINDTAAKTQGAYTPHPFGTEWNQGYYEMEMTINNASRLKVGLLQFADLERVGFNILPNASNASLSADVPGGDAAGYLHADASNAATLWTSGANSFGTGIVEKSTAALADYVKTIVYDTYAADDASDEDTAPQDPRNVRDYGGNRANIKIAYDCENYIITLFEKVGGEWVATSAIDYSVAVEQGKVLGACIDFQAYNANTNATIKNIRAKKGLSVTELHTYAVGTLETGYYTFFDAEAGAQLEASFAEYYGLTNYEFGFTADGATFVEDYQALYDELIDDETYGPSAIKLAPIVKYDELATTAVVRGVQVKANEDATYDVRFISAIGDIEGIAKVGYEVEKTVTLGFASKTTKTTVETDKVFSRFNANSMYYEASAIGGEYAVAMGLEDEAVVEDAVVTYAVTVYTIAQDGTKTVLDGTTTFTFVEGEYIVYGW